MIPGIEHYPHLQARLTDRLGANNCARDCNKRQIIQDITKELKVLQDRAALSRSGRDTGGTRR